jgi:site-specific recombinase XerD
MDSTIAKDLSLIGDLLRYVGNDAMEMYKAIYGNKKPCSYLGRKDALPDEVIEAIYRLARDTTEWSVLEGCLTVILGCAAGLRPQEARQMYIEDVHHLDSEPYVLIKHVKGEGKWGRVRSSPLNDGVSDIVEKFVRMREERLAYYHRESTAFFPTFRSDSEFITQQSMGKLKDVVQNILGVKFQLKDARRAYGQRMLDRGVPIEFVSHCLGHSSVATTQKFYADYRDKSVLSQVHGILNGRVQPSHN